jgi:shikimate dehydrogenase
VRTFNELEIIKDFDVILNTTSVGMVATVDTEDRKNEIRSLVPKDYMSKNQIVMDAVYKPYYTPMLEDALDVGARVIPGVEMFIDQGVAQFEMWTKQKAPRDIMQQVILDAFKEQK